MYLNVTDQHEISEDDTPFNDKHRKQKKNNIFVGLGSQMLKSDLSVLHKLDYIFIYHLAPDVEL